MKRSDIEKIIQTCYDNGLNAEANQLSKFIEDMTEVQLALSHTKIELELYQSFLKAGMTRPKVLEQVNVSATELLKVIDSLEMMEI